MTRRQRVQGDKKSKSHKTKKRKTAKNDMLAARKAKKQAPRKK